MSGMIGHDGVECEVFCPEHCGPEEIVCNGGKDYHGCPHGDFCIPSKGGKWNSRNLVKAALQQGTCSQYYQFKHFCCK